MRKYLFVVSAIVFVISLVTLFSVSVTYFVDYLAKLTKILKEKALIKKYLHPKTNPVESD